MTARSRRNAARFLALALAAGATLLLGGAGTAGADGPPAQLTAKGWWWEAQADQLPTALPPPPTVSAGQLLVQGDPSGKSAFAAVRFTVDASQSATALTLAVGDNGDQGGANAVVLACRTGSAWTAAEAGKWSTAPHVDTSACVNGQRSSDGKSWAFAVKPLQVGPTVDVAIVPGVDPTTTAPSTFSLSFNAPADNALATESGSPPPVTAPPPTVGAVGAGTTTGAPASTGTFHPAPVAPVATGLPADKVGQTATAPAAQAASQGNLNQAIANSTPAKDRNKTPGYLVLALAAAIGLYAWRQDNLIAMNGGNQPGAAEEPGGLGRFSRPRHGSPPALT